jgi:CO/xanthine dehydrogenase FAD-binding subunit
MKFPAFSYASPTLVSDAVQLLADNEDSRPLAGGQTLLPLLALRLASPSLLVDLGKIARLSTVELCDGVVRIGAMSTHAHNATVPETRAHLPLLTEALRHVAHEAVRNRGTIGGSIAHADAGAEMPLIATALDATMIVESSGARREVPASAFFLGHFTTALQPGELLTRIDFPCSVGSWAFEEVARRQGDFALVMAAAGLQIGDGRCRAVRLVIGSISDRPIRASEAESYLVGKTVTEETAMEASRIATHSLKTRSDIHASGAYRRAVAGVIVRRALLRAAAGRQV